MCHFGAAEIAQPRRTSPISHVVQGAATSFGQRFVKNKQIEGSSPGGAALFPPSQKKKNPTRIALDYFLFPPSWREQTFCSTFPRRKCPVPPKSCPPMERTTTTSCRTAAPTSFRTGKTRCEGSARSGKSSSSSVTSRFNSSKCAKKKKKTLAQTLPCESALVCRCVLRSLPRCPPRLSCHVSSPSPSYVSCTAAINPTCSP